LKRAPTRRATVTLRAIAGFAVPVDRVRLLTGWADNGF